MPEVIINKQVNPMLPDTFLRHMYIATSGEYWLDECHGNLIFHAHTPTIALGHSILSAAGR